jgi:hypothetical protein
MTNTLPSPWNDIVTRGLFRQICGPCPRCSGDAEVAEQLVWPYLHPQLHFGYCLVCTVCGAARLGDDVASLVLAWNQHHWSGGSQYGRAARDPYLTDAQVLERRAECMAIDPGGFGWDARCSRELYILEQVRKQLEDRHMGDEDWGHNANVLEQYQRDRDRCEHYGISVPPMSTKQAAKLAGFDLDAELEKQPITTSSQFMYMGEQTRQEIVDWTKEAAMSDEQNLFDRADRTLVAQYNRPTVMEAQDQDMLNLAQQYGMSGAELDHFRCLTDEQRRQHLLKLVQPDDSWGYTTGKRENTMQLPEPWSTIVANGWLDYFVAPCRYCTDQYFKADPTAQLTPEAPVWPRFNCAATEPAPNICCPRCASRRHARDTAIPVKFAVLVAEWNQQQWPADLLRGLWGDDAVVVRGRVEGYLKDSRHWREVSLPAYREVLQRAFRAHYCSAYEESRTSEQPAKELPSPLGNLAEEFDFLAAEKRVALGLPALGTAQPDHLRLQGPPVHDYAFACCNEQGRLLLTLHRSGDDVLTLYLPDRMTGEPEPVVVIKRWGETEVASKWQHRLGDLGQQFWRAVAHVYQALPLPVSPKQEAILAFCNEQHMTLAEFDRNYYARPGMTTKHEQGDLTGFGWKIVDILGSCVENNQPVNHYVPTSTGVQ